jgi:hypothetical protein
MPWLPCVNDVNRGAAGCLRIGIDGIAGFFQKDHRAIVFWQIEMTCTGGGFVLLIQGPGTAFYLLDKLSGSVIEKPG